MGARLLPRNLPELFSYSLVLEREAARRYAELERFLRGQGASALAAELKSSGARNASNTRSSRWAPPGERCPSLPAGSSAGISAARP